MSEGKSEVKLKLWVLIVKTSASTPLYYPEVKRLYEKQGGLKVELPERDYQGLPILRCHPWRTVDTWSHPHMPHEGMEPRDEEATDGEG